MTSNPGDEKVIQDNIHFKGDTRHRQTDGKVVVESAESITDAVDELVASHGSGVVELMPGEHTTPHVQLPTGVTMRGANGNDAGGESTVLKPDGDHPVVSLLGQSDGMARLEGVHVDTTGISGYSSGAVRILSGANTGGTQQLPWVENVSLEGTTGEGYGIHFYDVNDVGISWVTARGCRVLGFRDGIRKETNGTNGWVNGTRIEDTWLRNSTNLINETGENVHGNYYDVKVQVSSNTQNIITPVGQYTLDLHSFDSHNSPSDRLIKVLDVGGVTKNKINIKHGQRLLRGNIYGGGARRTSIDPESELNWLPAAGQPEWLVQGGTGSLSHSNFVASLDSGSTSGNAFRLADGNNRMLFINQHGDPWLHYRPNIPDATSMIGRTGFKHTGASNFEALFIADPTDSYATGITGNWFFRVVDDDGTVLSETDTGVALGSASRMSVCMSADGNRVFGCVGGNEIDNVALNTRQQFFSPFFEVETTTSASKSIELQRTVRLRYMDAE